MNHQTNSPSLLDTPEFPKAPENPSFPSIHQFFQILMGSITITVIYGAGYYYGLQ